MDKTGKRRALQIIGVFLVLLVLFTLWWWPGGLVERLGLSWARLREVPQEEQLPGEEVPVAGLREAMFWEELEGGKVRCDICFHLCVIPKGRRGFCRVRENIDGVLYSLVHARPSAIMIDPIEKEPQLHHRPGTFILCVGTVGCNFACKQCQNWTLSQASPTDRSVFDAPPEQLVALALEHGVTAISFTYNDPIVLFEYVFDTAVLAQEAGMGLIWHSNGAIKPEPLRKLLQYTTGVTIDLKGFCEEVYREIYSGCLHTVLDALKIIREEGVWLEIVNLVIPTINDCLDEIREMSEWIVANLGPDVPLHFSRFHPAFKLTHLPATPVETLEEARLVAREAGVNFVTVGNVPGHRYNSTFCPCTGERLIHRTGFTVHYNRIVDGRSPFSGQPIPGIWE